MTKKKTKVLLCFLFGIIIIITFPCQILATFEPGHMIQVFYKIGDNEVGIDLGHINSIDFSKEDYTIPTPAFDIHLMNTAHTWTGVSMGIFSYLKVSQYIEEYIFFITTEPIAPDSSSGFFVNAYNFVVNNNYSNLDNRAGDGTTDLNNGIIITTPDKAQSYHSKFNSSNILSAGQYAASNEGYEDGFKGELDCGVFDLKSHVDVYLYKFKLPVFPNKVTELIKGNNTDYIAVLRIHKDGSIVINPSLVSLDLNINGSGDVVLDPPGQTFSKDTVVTLTAFPEQGWHFKGWEGALTGSESPAILKMTSNKEVTANFEEGEYYLNVTTIGEGSVGFNPPGGIYKGGDIVTLTATPEEDWEFLDWGGDLTGSQSPATITMDANKQVTATFIKGAIEQFYLTVTKEGEGIVGIDPDLTSGKYNKGDSVILTAEPESGWQFKQWEWDGNSIGFNTTITIYMDADKEITAKFIKLAEYTLTVNTQGEGNVEIDPDLPGGIYKAGDEVTLTVTPEAGWEFKQWLGDTGDSDPNKSIIKININANKIITAEFIELPRYSLMVNTEGEGSVSPEGGVYYKGQNITLTAKEAEGWRFMKWEGVYTGESNPISISMDTNITINAIFYKISDYCWGDFDNDGDVDGEDLANFHNCIDGVSCSADFDGNHVVNDADLALFAQSYGRIDCPIDSPLPQYTLTLNIIGKGSIAPDPNRPLYNDGDEVTLTATPAAGCEFEQWICDANCTNNPLTLIMDDNQLIAALFTQLPELPHYTLTLDAIGEGSILINPDKDVYNEGDEVTLTAVSEMDWEFYQWTGDITGSNNSVIITMDENKAITALFSDQYKLTIYTEGKGTVDVNPIKSNEFELTAQPSEGWVFEEWRGDLTGNKNPATLNKDKNKQVIAIFTRLPFRLTTQITGGKGEIEPAEGTYFGITIVKLTAIPDPGYRIKSWSGTDDDTITENTNQVTVDSDRLVSVEFTELSDVDRDFLPDEEEKGPYGNNPFYDGNGDGIEDYKQLNVISMHIYNDRYYISIESQDFVQISEVAVIDPNLIQEEPPSGIEFELGLLSFALSGLNPGESTTLRLYLPPGMIPNTYFKFGPTPEDHTSHWYPFLFDGQTGAEINENIVTLHFVDGARGDDDLEENGTIVDIGGPGIMGVFSIHEEDSGGCFIASLKN